MANKTKNEIKTNIDTVLAENTEGAITAEKLKTLITDVADSASFSDDDIVLNTVKKIQNESGNVSIRIGVNSPSELPDFVMIGTEFDLVEPPEVGATSNLLIGADAIGADPILLMRQNFDTGKNTLININDNLVGISTGDDYAGGDKISLNVTKNGVFTDVVDEGGAGVASSIVMKNGGYYKTSVVQTPNDILYSIKRGPSMADSQIRIGYAAIDIDSNEDYNLQKKSGNLGMALIQAGIGIFLSSDELEAKIVSDNVVLNSSVVKATNTNGFCKVLHEFSHNPTLNSGVIIDFETLLAGRLGIITGKGSLAVYDGTLERAGLYEFSFSVIHDSGGYTALEAPILINRLVSDGVTSILWGSEGSIGNMELSITTNTKLESNLSTTYEFHNIGLG